MPRKDLLFADDAADAFASKSLEEEAVKSADLVTSSLTTNLRSMAALTPGWVGA